MHPQALAAGALAGDAGDVLMSALERLHDDVLVEVLQQLGPVEASTVRLVSRKMREAVDGVAWRRLAIRPRSVQQLKLTADVIQPPEPAGRHVHGIRLATAAGFILFPPAWPEGHDTMDCVPGAAAAVAVLLSACARSSGGLGSVAMQAFKFFDESGDGDGYDRIRAVEVMRFVTTALDTRGASCSCGTLKSLELDLGLELEPPSMPKDVVQRLARFGRLETLAVARLGCVDSAGAAALAAALPALCRVSLRLAKAAALAAFASHPALEELELSELLDGPEALVTRGFEAFAEGPAARRLRKLRVYFGGRRGFDSSELASLGRLVSLERLDLTIDLFTSARFVSEEDSRAELGPIASHLHSLAGALAVLCGRSLTSLSLTLAARGRPADAALAALLRASAPALIELEGGTPLLWGDAGDALASCARLRRLRLVEWSAADPVVPLATAAGVLAALPRLESLRGLPVPFESEREVAEMLGPLRRLAAACRLGDGAGCLFGLEPGAGVDGAYHERIRMCELARRRIRSVFPKADAFKLHQ